MAIIGLVLGNETIEEVAEVECDIRVSVLLNDKRAGGVLSE
jgi:hypothetical protein